MYDNYDDNKPVGICAEVASVDELIEIISKKSWSSAVFKHNYRSNATFDFEDMITLDVDGGCSLNSAMQIFADYKHVISTTRNHQKSKNGEICDRFRVVLFLSERITTKSTHSATYQHLLTKFPFCDEKCKNPGRHFYASNSVVSVNRNGLLIDPVHASEPEQTSTWFVSDESLPPVEQRISDFKKFLAKIKPESVSGRNNQIFTLSSIGHRDYALEYDAEQDVLEALLEFNARSASPLSRNEMLFAIKNGKRYAQNARGSFYANRALSITLLEDDEGSELKDQQDKTKKPDQKTSDKMEKLEKKVSKSGTRAAIIKTVLDEAEMFGINEEFKVVNDGLMIRYAKHKDNILTPCVSRHISNWFGMYYESRFTPQDCKVLVDAWTCRVENTNKSVPILDIKPFLFKSQRPANAYSWYRLSFDPSDDVFLDDLPEFYDILSRTSGEEATALILWIGSLLDYESDTSQYVHLSGEGNDGKGSLLEMLESIFTLSSCRMSSTDFTDRHASARLEGKRLVVFSDENNTHFMSSGKFKEMTGDNTMTINPKNEPSRSIATNFKIIIASNNQPSPEDNRADIRRLLPVYLSNIKTTLDTTYKKRLIKSAPQVMQYCYNRYIQWKKENPTSLIPSPVARLNEVVEHSKQRYTDILDEYFVFEKDGTLPRSSLYTFLKKNRYSDHDISKFYNILKSQGCEFKRESAGERRNLITGIKFKQITLQ